MARGQYAGTGHAQNGPSDLMEVRHTEVSRPKIKISGFKAGSAASPATRRLQPLSVKTGTRQQHLRQNTHFLKISLQPFVEASASVAECANPECNARFERFGLGQLFVFPIDDPLGWALPEHAKQKVVWLCSTCCQQMHVRLNRRKKNVQLVRKHISMEKAA